MIKTIKQWLSAAGDVMLPRLCPVCGKALDGDEQWLCRNCLAKLPRTRYEEVEFNTMEQHFAGKIPIERATAVFGAVPGEDAVLDIGTGYAAAKDTVVVATGSVVQYLAMSHAAVRRASPCIVAGIALND